jgi:hypothetical protein
MDVCWYYFCQYFIIVYGNLCQYAIILCVIMLVFICQDDKLFSAVILFYSECWWPDVMTFTDFSTSVFALTLMPLQSHILQGRYFICQHTLLITHTILCEGRLRSLLFQSSVSQCPRLLVLYITFTIIIRSPKLKTVLASVCKKIQQNALKLFIISLNSTYMFRPAPAIFRMGVIKYQVQCSKRV